MTLMTYRQALHDTLRAEMLRDENVFILGEEVARYNGAYKVCLSPSLLPFIRRTTLQARPTQSNTPSTRPR